MIPNIFISSTISDLHYLRDGLRDAIEELAYHPVMSDYSEVGYLERMQATDSCYQTVQQCQMVVLIIGTRYGSLDKSGFSVTHREYQSAQKANIPTITLVEAKVLTFREVYRADPTASLWDSFPAMDNPRKTFAFLEEIDQAETNNGIVPFINVAEAKRSLKLQLANFVGNRLQDTSASIDFRELLAEVKTLRNLLAHRSPTDGQPDDLKVKRQLATNRFLLTDKASSYRRFLEAIFRDLDVAVDKVSDLKTLENVFVTADWKYELVDGLFPVINGPPMALSSPEHGRFLGGHYGGMDGDSYELFEDRTVRISRATFAEFDGLQRTLHAKTQNA